MLLYEEFDSLFTRFDFFIIPWFSFGLRVYISEIFLLTFVSFTVVLNTEEDVATYTIRSVDDPRTLNKILYVRPPGNTLSYNDLVSLWEKHHSEILKRVYVSEDKVLKIIKG